MFKRMLIVLFLAQYQYIYPMIAQSPETAKNANKVELAQKYYNNQDVLSLEKLVNKWIKKSRDDMNYEPYFWKGKLYILLHRIDEGISYLVVAANADKKNGIRWSYLIKTCISNNKFVDARMYLAEARKNYGYTELWLNDLELEYESKMDSIKQIEIQKKINTAPKAKTIKGRRKEQFEEKLEGWIGSNIVDYIRANGVYTDLKQLPNDKSIYIFTKSNEGITPIWGEKGEIWGGGSYKFTCSIELETDVSGVITFWRYQGNGCF